MISMIIPTYTINKELQDMAVLCAYSYREQVDELIIAEDGGMYSPDLFQLADTYLYHRQNQGFVKNVNDAWKIAQQNYVMIVNSDTSLARGKLEDLCIEGKITSPVTKGQNVPFLAGHFFVVPKTFGVALNDEKFIMHCSDFDLERRYPNDIIQIPEVAIYHEIHATLNVIGEKDAELLARDRSMV